MPTLNEQYQSTIDEQRNYLTNEQKRFNEECEKIKAGAKERVAQMPETEADKRQTIMDEEKAKLEDLLKTLKKNVHESTRVTMKKLEEIQRQREAKTLLELEQEMLKAG